MSNQPYVQIVGHAFRESEKMPRVGAGKSPVAAFVVGFMFGPLGVGLYLKSWPDFFLLLGLILVGSFMTAGLGAPFFWCLCGFWGAARVARSNRGKAAPLPPVFPAPQVAEVLAKPADQ
jgi:hypothetical protein